MRLTSVKAERYFLVPSKWREIKSANPARELRLRRSSQFLAPALHRRWNAHRLAIFCYRSAGNVDARFLEFLDNRIVGKNGLGALGIDQLLDPVPHGLGRMRVAAIGRG